MSCPQCFSGHVNPGTPSGRIEQVYGRKTYIAEPPAGKTAQGIVVVISDAFGLPFVNNQILADHYASAGPFLVYLPDFMDDKQASVQCMLNMAHVFDKNASWLQWSYYLAATVAEFVPHLIRNRFSVAWPKVTSWMRALREDKSVTLPVGVAGFCWGGLHATFLTHSARDDNKTASGQLLADAYFIAHPSNLSLPADIEAVSGNLSVAIGDDDAVMDIKQARQMEQILTKKKDVESEVVIYPGAKHGFSVRASRWEPDSQETRQAQEAEEQAIAWFQRQFKSHR